MYLSIYKVLGSKFCCKSVQSSLTSLKSRIAVLPEKLEVEEHDLGQAAIFQNDPNVPLLTESTIRKCSPFERHFKATQEQAIFEITEDGAPNIYFSPEILKVFEQYMYLYPLWSGSMLRREGITRDTNADVENWFGVVKNTILQKKKNINAGLFIRKLHVQVKGRATELTLPTLGKKEKTDNIENVEEVWKKTPQKGKKSKYFNSPKCFPTPRKKFAPASLSKVSEKKPKSKSDANSNNVKATRITNLKTGEDLFNEKEEDGQWDKPLPKLARSIRTNIPKEPTTLPKVTTRTSKKVDLETFLVVESDSSSNVEITSLQSEENSDIHRPGISSYKGNETCKEENRLGIVNNRNNCWLSSALQSFTPMIPLFQEVKHNTGNVLFDTCREKIQSLWSRNKRQKIYVDDVLDILNADPEYKGKGNEQQDPALFFSELLRELTIQTDMAKLIINYQHTCCKCQKTSQSKPEDVFVLSTEIPCALENIGIQDCLSEFFKEEVVEKNCRHCARNTKHIRRSKTCQYPKILILQLKRFSPDMRKLNKDILINRRVMIDDVQYRVKAVQTFHWWRTKTLGFPVTIQKFVKNQRDVSMNQELQEIAIFYYMREKTNTQKWMYLWTLVTM